jgi:hypothetical protein
MQKFSTCAVVALLFTSLAYSQEQGETQKTTTKLEQFQAKTGIVVVRGYTKVGSVSGTGGSVSVDARDFRDARNPQTRLTGVSIEVFNNGGRTNTAFIDNDEIESLLAGLDYISKVTKDITPLSSFEIEYRTKGDFSITVFNTSNNGLSAAVSAGRIGKTLVYIPLQKLTELRQLILDAKSKT